ncbi:meiotic nuclear division protein 1 [Fimicolochytrium jonesii]|uniref:meiotic nuclear division protein 1 n=1 Tax=Fimicolochytrium jonesii TaxID=1396493 RepID=UPI0022FECF12|nr:meiotic nuclear division protein 1 [Fimicolochytrium jonesii]KAI8818380.1 meiotic nuclear division protein 1 [Fimicolochytrium jonesii]
MWKRLPRRARALVSIRLAPDGSTRRSLTHGQKPVAQTIKEVLDSLVSDNIVTMEKIGTSNYYWSFPSTAVQTRKRKIDELEQELDKLESKRKKTKSAVEQSKSGCEETEDRATFMEELAAAEAKRKEYKAELEKFKDCDPALIEAKERAVATAKAAANRWTDNIFALQSYCGRNFGISASQFAEQFGMKDDFDTLP